MSSTPAALLHSPESYEQPTDEPWVEARVRDASAQIVHGADDAFDPDGLWPAVEEWDSRGIRLPLTGLYAGAAGVVLALDQLRRRDYAETRLDLADVVRRVWSRLWSCRCVSRRATASRDLAPGWDDRLVRAQENRGFAAVS